MEKPESEYNMVDWWKKVVFKNYANFSGRARRAEYWWFTLFQIILMIPLYAISIAGTLNENLLLGSIVGIIFLVALLVTIIPSLAVMVRRLHDINKSGWYYFISFIPFVGSIILLVWLCTAGDGFVNKYGEDPKNEGELQFDFDKPQEQF